MQKRQGHPVGITVLAAVLLLLFAVPTPAQAHAPDDPAEEGTVLDFEVTRAAADGVIGSDAEGSLEGSGLDRATIRSAALAQGGGRDWYIGARGGAYFDVDEPFIGAELLFPLPGRLWFNPNLEWVFIDPGDLYTINFDVHYDLPTDGPYMFWLGAGLALSRFDPAGPREADTEPGLNLLGGLGFARSGLIPYVQAKALIDDNDTEFILAGGIRF